MVESIALETATDVIGPAETAAEKIDNPMDITVAKSEGNLIA